MYSEDNKIFENKIFEIKKLYEMNSTFFRNNKDVRSGMDQRIEKEENDISKIHKIHNNMKLMVLLQSSLAYHEKIDIIQSYEDSHSVFKIKLGGLMNDWEFEEFS
jgi:hypothetical protein